MTLNKENNKSASRSIPEAVLNHAGDAKKLETLKKMVERYLEAADSLEDKVSLLVRRDWRGNNILHTAAAKGSIKAVDFILQKARDLNEV